MKYKYTYKFQDGGAAPAPEAAPAPQGGEDPMVMLIQGAQQAIQTQDCQTALLVCQMLVELAQGGAPAGGGAAPAEAAPAPAEGEPVYRMGGKLARRISK